MLKLLIGVQAIDEDKIDNTSLALFAVGGISDIFSSALTKTASFFK
ncbi:hypothetical protein M4D55_00155 [Metabacillus idriensis]|nr:hypothetical protein [Metabacillus idriensis]MCM3594194.1 hypothetical protein [Metabacillus idriensis]